MTQEILWKAGLYGVAMFMTPMAEKIVPYLYQDTMPTPAMWLGSVIMGIIAAAMGLRMFFDGSYEKMKSENKDVPPPPPAP